MVKTSWTDQTLKFLQFEMYKHFYLSKHKQQSLF